MAVSQYCHIHLLNKEYLQSLTKHFVSFIPGNMDGRMQAPQNNGLIEMVNRLPGGQLTDGLVDKQPVLGLTLTGERIVTFGGRCRALTSWARDRLNIRRKRPSRRKRRRRKNWAETENLRETFWTQMQICLRKDIQTTKAASELELSELEVQHMFSLHFQELSL